MTVQQRIRDVLAAMSQVSEAPGQSVVVFDPNTHHEWSIPSGVRTSVSVATLDPGRPVSLYDEWAVRFEQMRSADELTLLLLVRAAETALAAYTHRHPGREVDEHDDPTAGTEARCLREYAGVDSKEAAVIESAAYGGDPNRLAKWLERLRVRNDQHPVTGQPKPVGEGRRRRVAELRAQGMGAKRIAQELGCAVSTAQKVMREVDDQKQAA